jgi:hypothetical protein
MKHRTKLVKYAIFILVVTSLVYGILRLSSESRRYCDKDIQAYIKLSILGKEDLNTQFTEIIKNQVLFEECTNFRAEISTPTESELLEATTQFECNGIQFEKIFYYDDFIYDKIVDIGSCDVTDPVFRESYDSNNNLSKQIVRESMIKNEDTCIKISENPKFNLFNNSKEKCEVEFK